jgi:hypothetical protein
MMKTLLVLAAGAILGFGLHYVYEFGLELWMVGICSLVFAGGMFYDYYTRPGVKRGRK